MSVTSEASVNPLFQISIPTMNTAIRQVVEVSQILTRKLFEIFVTPLPFEVRLVKGLKLVSSRNIAFSSNDTTELELYVIRTGLTVNPIAANAQHLRELANKTGDVCEIIFGTFEDGDNAMAWLDEVYQSIACNNNNITVCKESNCTKILSSRDEILGYKNNKK